VLSTSTLYAFPPLSAHVTGPTAGSSATLTTIVWPADTPAAGTVIESVVPLVPLPLVPRFWTSAIAPSASPATRQPRTPSTRSEDRSAFTPPSCFAAVLRMRKLDPDDRRHGCSVRREIDPTASVLPPDRTRKPRLSRASPVTARPAPGRLARQGMTDQIRLPVAAAGSGFNGQLAGQRAF